MWLDSQVGRLQNGLYFSAVMFPTLLVSISLKIRDMFESSFAFFSFLSIIFFWTGFQTARVTFAGFVSHVVCTDRARPAAGKCEGEDAVLALRGFTPIGPSKCVVSVATLEGVACGGGWGP